jgi:hypothetical protein
MNPLSGLDFRHLTEKSSAVLAILSARCDLVARSPLVGWLQGEKGSAERGAIGLCKESENLRKDSGYLAETAYYAEIDCMISKFGVLYRIILPIHSFWDIRRKLSVY